MFDYLAATLKTYPLLSGSLAYLMAILAILVKKKGANLKVEVDGEVKHDGPLLLTAVANGCFCGGGVKSSPMASILRRPHGYKYNLQCEENGIS